MMIHAEERPTSGDQETERARFGLMALQSCLPRRAGRDFASACPNYCRSNSIFHRRACVGQIAISAIQLVGDIAAFSADSAVIKPADGERLAICERDNLCRFINPEAQVIFDARRSTSSRRVHDDSFFC
jgi:hypothetical protein